MVDFFDFFKRLYIKYTDNKKERTRKYWVDELDDLDDYRYRFEHCEKRMFAVKKLFDDINVENKKLISTNMKLQKLFINNKKPNYTDWIIHQPKFKTTDGLYVPPNTFLTINDRDIKKVLIQKGFHKMSYEKLIWKLEQWCYDLVRYEYDNTLWQALEKWTTASHVFKKRISDCEDHAILFQTCMHILGYGDKSVVIVNNVKFGNGYGGGHAYNKVLLDEKWMVVDPTNPKKFKKSDWQYDIKTVGLNWFFNYWGIYKIKNEGVLNKQGVTN